MKLVGHSLGGGMATDAGLKHGVESVLFAPSPLNNSVINELPKDNVKNAEKLIEYYDVEGDPVAEKLKHIPGLRALGTAHAIKPDKAFGTGMRDCHENFADHILSDGLKFEKKSQ